MVFGGQILLMLMLIGIGIGALIAFCLIAEFFNWLYRFGEDAQCIIMMIIMPVVVITIGSIFG